MNLKKGLSARVWCARIGYFLLAWMLVICIIAQVFIAGLAIFDNPINWVRHTSFVHVFEFVPLVMFALGFLGRLSRLMIWGSLGLYALVFIQYATANLASAFHTVIALVLFWGSLTLTRHATQVVFARRTTERGGSA